ncbi:MAG: dipeptide ABC transporter ATP-binding protein [Gammaproteobacteria bacterium]
MSNVLSISTLTLHLPKKEKTLYALDDVSFSVKEGEIFCLVGESGSGKSLTAQAILQLIPEALYGEHSRIALGDLSLLDLSEVELQQIRGKKIAMIFQEPMTSLNPVMTIGQQIIEVLQLHTDLDPRACRDKAIALLDSVGIAESQVRVDDYPHQLSGGMKQRVMIAMALATNPVVLVADEPTTALDVTIQAQVLRLIASLRESHSMGILMITHDFAVVSEIADTVAVMYAGQIIEKASRDIFFNEPKHPYSKKLLASLPSIEKRDESLAAIAGQLPDLTRPTTGCRFAPRCAFKWSLCDEVEPALLDSQGTDVRCHLYSSANPPKPAEIRIPLPAIKKSSKKPMPLLSVKHLNMHYPIQAGLFKRTVGYIKAVDDIDFELSTGETLAIVGESGCGKSSLANALLRLSPYASGEVYFNGDAIHEMSRHSLQQLRRYMQVVFQDPFGSLNPRMSVRAILSEGWDAQGMYLNPTMRAKKLDELLTQVGLPLNSLDRYPHEFSGGQRQRIAIARALSVEPKLVICDEPTSALDVSVQAQIVHLLKDLQETRELAYIFISHNIALVGYLADRVAVMYLGKIVERGPVKAILESPKHPYTQALLASVPEIGKKLSAQSSAVGELPSPSHPPVGCHYHPRCPFAMDICRVSYPPVYKVGEQDVRCYLYVEAKHLSPS